MRSGRGSQWRSWAWHRNRRHHEASLPAVRVWHPPGCEAEQDLWWAHRGL